MTLIIISTVLLYLIHALLPPYLDYVLPGRFVEGLYARDTPPPTSLISQRARRALNNMNEAMLMFMPLALLAVISGSAAALPGAIVFLAARVAYLPAYIMGVPVFRSLAWGIGLLGLGWMMLALI